MRHGASDDVEELGALWDTEFVETKARAGQMVLDGDDLPFDAAAG